MEQDTKVNGAKRLIKNTDGELRFGGMGRCTKGFGRTIKLGDGGDSFMQLVIHMKGNGLTTWLTG